MSRSLLAKLNGSNHGEFAEWLENHPWEPRIAWYPSCGHDFSDLLYLHKSETRRSFRQMPEAPEIFIHTDCSMQIRPNGPLNPLRIHWHKFVHCDEWTRVSVISNEELPTLDISSKACDDGHSQFGASPDYGRVFFLRLHIESDRLGSILQPVLYAVVENGAFASQVLLETEARITHIWNVLPGGKPSPWIGYLLKRLKTECLIRERDFYTDEDLEYQRQEYFTCFPNLAGDNKDVPDPAGWNLARSFAGREKIGLHCHLQKGSKREGERRTLDMLCAKSASWSWLESNYGAQFFHFNRHGTAFITFSKENPTRNIHTDLYPQRREVAKRVAEGFAHASGDTYFAHFPRGDDHLFNWDDKYDSETCTFKKSCYHDWIFNLNWSKRGEHFYIFFRINSSHSTERFFWQMESVFDVLKRFLDPFIEIERRKEEFRNGVAMVVKNNPELMEGLEGLCGPLEDLSRPDSLLPGSERDVKKS